MMLARSSWLLLLSRAGLLLASVQSDCGGVLLPSVTSRILQYDLLVSDSINGTKCSWILQAPSSQTVELDVISYQTVSQTDTSCTSAYLAIKLGPTQKEKRFCQPFWSIPEIGRKLVIRGKGPGVVTLRSAYGMKQGFTLRYLVLVPDANHREIETRAKELRTLIPLVSSVKGEGEQVYLSKGETVTFSTATGKEQQSISDYPSMSTMWKRQRPPWTHQSSWSPRHSKLLVHPSDQRRTRFPLQPGEVPAREDSHSDFSTIFDSKSLRTHTSTERSKSSLGPEMLKVAPSDSKSSLQLYLTSILSSPSSLISPSPSLSEPTSPTPSPSPSSLTSPSSPTSLSISTTSSPSPSTSLTPSGSTSPTPSNLIFLSPSGLTSPLPSSLTSPSAFSSSLISLSPSGPTSSTSSPTSSPSDPSFPTSSRTNSVSTLVLNSKSNLNSTLSLSASFPSSLLLPENTTMIDNVPLMSLKNALAPSSAVPDKGQGDVMSQSESKPSRQSMLELSESAWGVFPGSQQNSSSGQELHSTWSAESTQINNGEDYVDTRGDVNMHLLNTSPGELQSLLQISGDVVSSISPKTDQTSITQSTPPSQTMAFKISSVTVAIPGDELSQDKCKCNHSDTHGITRSADHGMELETRPQSWDDMEVPVTLTPARDPSPDLSILTEEGVVEMSPGGGSVSRVERSSTASAKVWTESREQNALPGFPASSSELITPQLEQDRKQESESDQHMLFLSQITDIPTSESLSVNTQDLVDSFRIDSVAETVNQSEATHWMLDFKDVSSDFGGTITPALSQVMIKSTSSSWSMFEFPELMTHSSSLPVQEVTNGAEIDTATLSYESRPSDSAHLSEILPTVASLSDAVTTQGARSQFPVTDENALTTQGVSFNNRIPSSVSFSPGTTLPSISDGNGGEMVSVQETGDSFDTTGPGSEIVSTRDIPVENGVNVTVFTITKNRTTEAMTTHSQRLEVTPNAKSSSGFSVLFDFSGTEKDGNRTNALLDSTTEMIFTTEPSGKTDWFEQGTSSPSNSGRKNMDGFPTKGNLVSDDSIPSFSPRTFAPEPITPQSPVNISPPSVEVNHSASPPKEIFPTTLPFTWMPERSSTRLQGSLPLTRSRGIILPTSSKTTMLRSNNPESSSGRTVESPTPAGERFRKTSTPIMNQTFQEVSRPLVASGISSFTPGSLDQTRPDTRRPTPSSLPVLTHPVVSVTNLAQFLPSVSTFETASQPFTDQKGSRSSQTVGSSPETSVSDSGEPAWSTTVHLKFTVPLPPAFPSVEEEGKIVTSEEPPLSSTLQLNQLGSQSNDDLPGPNVTHVDTKKLSNNPSQSTQPGRNKQWQREILSTLVAAHTASSEGFWTWGQSDLGTLPTSHGVVPTLASSVSPEGTRSLPTGAMITKSLITPSIPNTPASGRDNSWMPGRDDTSLGSPTPAMGILTSLLPTSQQLHSHVNTTSSGKTLQITMHQPTSGTHWEVMNSVSSFTPTEKLKHIFIVGNKLPMIKEDATVKIPTKLILDMNFTLQLADSTSEKYQNLVVDFTNKVSPFYKNVPGFQQLQVKRFSSGSVLIDFDVIFIAKEIRSYLLDPRLIFNITGLYDAISGGFEIDGAQVLGAYISESFIALCGEVFSCQTGFQCIHSNTGNVSCTSLCHTDYCKNSGICTHNVGQGPVCQICQSINMVAQLESDACITCNMWETPEHCVLETDNHCLSASTQEFLSTRCPVGIDYWFMGPRCDYRMTRQSLIGIAFAVVLSLLLVMGAVAIVVLRRFKILLIEAKVDQTKSSYKRFSRFDDFSNQYQSHPWLNYSVSSLDNPGFSNSDELIHLQMLDSSYYSCHEESVTGTYSSWRTTPHDRSTFRHSLQNNLDFSISSINEHAGDSGKASDLSVYSWPIEPLQWSPFPILYQLNRDRPFKARRPRSYCEGMELVSMERNWTA